jgi:hypothetical protein
MSRLPLLPALVLAAAAGLAPRPASAIPVFAHRYGLTCQACHTEVPHLTAFGEAFLANGYRMPGLKAKPAFPVAVRIQVGYSSAASPAEAPLPRTIVDEVEFLTGGAAGSRGSYFAEIYAVDGGRVGRARDVWAGWRATPDGARVPVTIRAGQMTLTLPLDPETFRETTDHYAIWDQTAGENPFTFFQTKIGAQIAVGNSGRGLSGTASLLAGHDPGSGLPTHGRDTFATLQQTVGELTLNVYRYDGSRRLSRTDDRFWRTGYGVGWERRRTRIDVVYQSGNDTNAGMFGEALQTSGGFVQVRQALSDRTFALARWDATQSTAVARAFIYGAGCRLSRNTRLTLFESAQRAPGGGTHHTISSSFLVAF